jgi:hypothetical protein
MNHYHRVMTMVMMVVTTVMIWLRKSRSRKKHDYRE